jgi:hypothetical protein
MEFAPGEALWVKVEEPVFVDLAAKRSADLPVSTYISK